MELIVGIVIGFGLGVMCCLAVRSDSAEHREQVRRAAEKAERWNEEHLGANPEERTEVME